MVKASESLVRILVKSQKYNESFFGKYGVRATPTLKFIDSQGKEVAEMDRGDAGSLEKQIYEIALKYDRGPKGSEEVGKSIEEAKAASKLLALYFFDTQGGSAILNTSLRDASVRTALEKFVFAKVEVKKGSEECKRFKVTASNTLLILDPAAEKPEASPVRKITGRKTPKDLVKELEEALKKAEKK